MTALLLLRLRLQEWMLIEEIEDGEGLLLDHERRLGNKRMEVEIAKARLAAIRRRINAAETPESIIRRIAT